MKYFADIGSRKTPVYNLALKDDVEILRSVYLQQRKRND